MKRMVIVGNGPLSRNLSVEVDAADFVLRFNEPKEAIGMSGTRTDRLMMANSGKPQQRRLEDPAFMRSPIFLAAKELMFTYHPEIIQRYFRKPNPLSRLKGRRADWTLVGIRKFGGAGKEIRIMPPQFYLRGCKELGVPPDKMHEIFPSTGYFGIWHALETMPAQEWRIAICGFTWEGWRRHAWADERAWVEKCVAEGRIALLDQIER
jgi:hypothetical protein